MRELLHKFKDTDEHIRFKIFKWLVKIRYLGSIISIARLVLVNSISIYNMLEWRNVNPYLAIFGLIICFGMIILFVAYVFYDKLDLRRVEQFAEIKYSPINVYIITPYEEQHIRRTEIPIMEAIHSIMPNGEFKTKFEKEIKLIKECVDLGVFPKKYAPRRLWKYYLTDKGRL